MGQRRDEITPNLAERLRWDVAQREWYLGHPTKKTARPVRVHVMFTLLMFTLATAYRWRGEQEAVGSTSSGWQR